MGSRFLPLQVAAVCYRKCDDSYEFLLVNTTGGDRWIFPKGAAARRLSRSQAAEREALEEAGAIGAIEPGHFHLYLQPKGDSKSRNSVQEFVVKAFLLQVSHTQASQEQNRNPTWFSVDGARSALAMGREAKYAAELRTVIDRAVERLSAQERVVPDSSAPPTHGIWRSLLKLLGVRLSFDREQTGPGRFGKYGMEPQRKQQELDTMKAQLDEVRKKLEEMQETGRK